MGLEEQLASKLQQVQLFQAENTALQVREKVLQTVVNSEGKDLHQLLQEQEQLQAGGAASAAAQASPCASGGAGSSGPRSSGMGGSAACTPVGNAPTPRMRESGSATARTCATRWSTGGSGTAAYGSCREWIPSGRKLPNWST